MRAVYESWTCPTDDSIFGCVNGGVCTPRPAAAGQSWAHWNDLAQTLLRNGRPLQEVRDVVKSWHEFKKQQAAVPWLPVVHDGMESAIDGPPLLTTCVCLS